MRILQLIEDGGACDVRELSSLFDALEAVEPAELVGDWSGGDFDDGSTHPCRSMMESIKWAGMLFKSTDDVAPVMSWTDDGKRVENEYWGRAQIREVKYRGIVSTCVIFDSYPIMDHFRRVSDNTLMGLLDAKEKVLKDAGPYYFWIRK
ncbi:Transcription factor [Neofusicoccum parvum]|uniref:Uncharacterized protein n=3 Tax=Neofusicoccum TaxID=407951 RepID=A0ABR3SJN4_9PEZI|nr:putative transcription factor cmr1 protein [Neofusicoccum parvum UCRNP2]GME31343.1 Transcription factor [Neofusicoccum parvum]GME48615.1 Transcription factor [Neofusicoccum parvum]